MRSAIRLALLGLLVAVACAAGDDFLGPRVTLDGELTLAEAASAFGRQVGCTVQVPTMERARAQRKVALALRGVSPTAARTGLEEAFGVTLRRWWRGGYGVELRPPTPGAVLGQPLAAVGSGWTCWLSNMRIGLDSAVQALTPDGLRVDATLTPRFVIETPSDAEGLRILGCSRPRLERWEPERLDRRGRDNLVRWSAGGQDPSVWVLEQPMPLPDRDATQLDRLCFDLHLLHLTQHAFVFDDLDRAETQTQSDADMDLRLTPGGDRGALRLELRAPLADTARELFNAAMGRESMIDCRLLSADEQLLPGNVSGIDRDAKDGQWTCSLTYRPQSKDDGQRPARLEVTVLLPVGEVEVQTIEFRHVPLPPQP